MVHSFFLYFFHGVRVVHLFSFVCCVGCVWFYFLSFVCMLFLLFCLRTVFCVSVSLFCPLLISDYWFSLRFSPLISQRFCFYCYICNRIFPILENLVFGSSRSVHVRFITTAHSCYCIITHLCQDVWQYQEIKHKFTIKEVLMAEKKINQ